MSGIRIWLEDAGVADILRRNPKLEQLERETMERKLSQIEASFIQTFGFQGQFEIQAIQTRPGQPYGRLTFRIRAANAATGAALKRNPGWLAQFL